MRAKLSIVIAALMVTGCFTGGGSIILAQTSKEATEEIRVCAKARNMSEADANTAVSVLSDLVAKGIPVEHALDVVKSAINRNRSGQEIASIARSLGDTVEKEGSAKEIAAITMTCLEKGLREREIAAVMLKVEEAMKKDASARQLRILTKDLLDEGSDADGLSAAIESVGKSVEQGFSPEESRKSVALVALKGLKDGLRGEALAAEIRKEAQLGEGGRGETERHRERVRQTSMPEEVKDKIKTPEGTAKSGGIPGDIERRGR